jgi:hypothetical protein
MAYHLQRIVIVVSEQIVPYQHIPLFPQLFYAGIARVNKLDANISRVKLVSCHNAKGRIEDYRSLSNLLVTEKLQKFLYFFVDLFLLAIEQANCPAAANAVHEDWAASCQAVLGIDFETVSHIQVS